MIIDGIVHSDHKNFLETKRKSNFEKESIPSGVVCLTCFFCYQVNDNFTRIENKKERNKTYVLGKMKITKKRGRKDHLPVDLAYCS